jgi:HK97 family phage major capsid protein
MSIQALRERHAALNKSANHLLAEKGSAVWSAEDKAKFDGLMDEAERVQTQIEAHQRALDADARRNFKDAQRAEAQPKTEAQRALDIYLRKSVRDMSVEEVTLVRNTMSTTTGSEGGFTVKTDVAASLVDQLKSYGSMRRVAERIVTSQGGPLGYPTTDGRSETGEIVAQNQPAAAADIVFGTRDLATSKFSSKIIAVPIELLQDSMIDVQALVFKRMRDRIGRYQNTMFTTGSGTSQPTGVITAASVGKTGATGQTTTIIYDDLVDIVDAVDVAYTDEASAPPKFMFSQTMRRVVRKIKDTAGRPIWTPSYDAGVSDSRTDLLLGYEVVINNDVAVPAANAYSLAFGQLGNYMVRDAMDVTLFRFDDSAYMSKGQVGFLGWARAGGNLLDLASVVTYRNSAT